MAKAKKVVVKDTTEEDEPIIEQTIPLPMYEDVPTGDVQSEYDFLTELLRAQEDGNWHGPAAGMIRERIKLISNG